MSATRDDDTCEQTNHATRMMLMTTLRRWRINMMLMMMPLSGTGWDEEKEKQEEAIMKKKE